MLRPVFIAVLEVKRFLADLGDLAFSIALPIVLFALMYAAFGNDVSFNATAHVADLDGGARSEALVASIRQVDGLTVKLYTGEELDDALDRSAVLSGAFIPAGFSAALDAGVPVAITFKQRGHGGDEGQIVASIIQGVAGDMGGEVKVRNIVSTALADSGITQEQLEIVLTDRLTAARTDPPVVIERRLVGGGGDIVDRLLPGVVVMFLMFSVTLAAQSIVGERSSGTLERLMTTSLSVNQLFVGKFLAATARGTLQAVLLLGLGFAVLQVAGVLEFLQVVLLTVLVAGSVGAMGLVIGAVAKTRDQAAWTAVFLTMFMAIFGGTFFDAGDGGALGILSRFTINKYAIEAMEGVLTGAGNLADQGPEIAVMAGVAIVALVVARSVFRVTERGR